jgi:hypothetical protein
MELRSSVRSGVTRMAGGDDMVAIPKKTRSAHYRVFTYMKQITLFDQLMRDLHGTAAPRVRGWPNTFHYKNGRP